MWWLEGGGIISLLFLWWSGLVGGVVDCINEVNQRQARLVLGG